MPAELRRFQHGTENRQDEGEADQHEDGTLTGRLDPWRPPDEPIHDEERLDQAPRRDDQRHRGPRHQDQLRPGTLILRVHDRAGQHTRDPDGLGQFGRVLVRRVGHQPDDREDDVHKGHHEEEHPEGDRPGEDAPADVGVETLDVVAGSHDATALSTLLEHALGPETFGDDPTTPALHTAAQPTRRTRRRDIGGRRPIGVRWHRSRCPARGDRHRGNGGRRLFGHTTQVTQWKWGRELAHAQDAAGRSARTLRRVIAVR